MASIMACVVIASPDSASTLAAASRALVFLGLGSLGALFPLVLPGAAGSADVAASGRRMPAAAPRPAHPAAGSRPGAAFPVPAGWRLLRLGRRRPSRDDLGGPGALPVLGGLVRLFGGFRLG